MSLPDFVTGVEFLDEGTCDTVFDDFTRHLMLDDLFLAAEWYIRHRTPMSSVYSFRELPGGLMRFVIGLIIKKKIPHGAFSMHSHPDVAAGSELDDRLMEYYGLRAESLPPRLLVREAVALRIRLGTVLSDIESNLPDVDRASLVREVAHSASTTLGEQEAFGMSDEEAGDILGRSC